MKRLTFFLILALFFILGIYFAFKFTILHLAKRQLTGIFAAGTVTVKSCSFYPTHLLRLSDIEIKKEPVYNVKIKETNIEYNLFSLLKGTILKFSFKEILIKINLSKKNISELSEHLNLKLNSGSLFLIKKMQVSDTVIDIESKDLKINAVISAQLDLKQKFPDYLDLRAAYINTPLIDAEDIVLNCGRDTAAGILNIKSLKYNKLKIEEIKSKTRLTNKTLFLDAFTANLLEGRAKGEVNLKIREESLYYANLNFIGLNIDTFINTFDLNEKLQMSGKINGSIVLKGGQSDIGILQCDFSTLEPGGKLIIKDKKVLEYIANSSKQPLEIIVENFKDYRYNIGIMKAGLDNNNLIFNAALDGKTGKRNLEITLHDFKLFSIGKGLFLPE